MTSLPERATNALEPILKALEKLDDESKIHVAAKVNDILLDAQRRVAESRRAAVRSMRAEGHTLSELGVLLGMSTARVHQIEQGYGRKEKAMRAGR
jgi:DNA-directed RNA polymerase sigma subunit (sigma70/sigma32)